MEWTASAIRALRDRLKVSQRVFGRMLGYARAGAQTRTSELERGIILPTRTVQKLLDRIEAEAPPAAEESINEEEEMNSTEARYLREQAVRAAQSAFQAAETAIQRLQEAERRTEGFELPTLLVDDLTPILTWRDRIVEHYQF